MVIYFIIILKLIENQKLELLIINLVAFPLIQDIRATILLGNNDRRHLKRKRHSHLVIFSRLQINFTV